MKIEKNISVICWMPISSFCGIIVGIVDANYIHKNIGIGIALGWSIGFFIGALISFLVYKIKSKADN